MYGTIRRYRIRSGSIEEIVASVKKDLVPLLEKMPGFVGYYVINAESNRATSITFGETRDAVNEMNRVALKWVHETLPDRLSEPEVLAGEVPVALVHQHA